MTEEIEQKSFASSDATASSCIAKIAKALSSAQGKFKPIQKNCTNPFFKRRYADLAGINEAVRDALVTNEIAVTQIIIPDDEFAIVDTLLLHSSGEWIKSRISLRPDKIDPQRFGSAVTYARRYALAAILGVAAEDDDDANAVTKSNGSTATAKPAEKSAPAGEKPAIKQPNDPITDAQTKKLHVLAKQNLGKDFKDKMREAMFVLYGKQSSKNLTKGEASEMIDLLGKKLLEAEVETKKMKGSAADDVLPV